MLSPFAVVVLACAVCAQAAQFTLHHRVLVPSSSSTPFAVRGTLDLSGDNVRFESVSTVSEDLALFAEKLSPTTDTSETLYQIALQHPGDASETEWAVSSVKLCYLSVSTSQTLFLYLSEEDSPFAIDYFLSPVSHNGACPSQATTSPLKTFSERVPYLNTTILVRRPVSPPLPELKTPPPLTPEGEILQPIPEKGFLQKYWIYISVFLIAIMLTGGSEPPAK